MAETINCPFCGEKNRPEDFYCRTCDGDLNREKVLTGKPGKEDNNSLSGKARAGNNGLESDEFSELDYRPRSKAGCFIPGLVILMVLGIITAGIFVLSDGFDLPPEEEEAEAPELEIPEDEDDVIDEEEEAEPDPEPVEDEPEEPEPEGEDDPDYDQMEAALLNWLIGRIDDPMVTLLHVEEAQDPEEFYDRYDLTEEEVIVYKEKSRDGEFVTVAFGPPFSEWSIRAVFIWDHNEWRFLREEEVR